LELSTLWAQGISGDLPIVLARIDDTEDFDLIRQLLRAHEYWRMKQLSADVVIINERAASYVQELQGSLEALVRGSQLRLSPDTSSASGKIFLLRGDLLTAAARAQLQVIARVVLLSRRGTLAEQISRAQVRETGFLAPTRITRPSKYAEIPAPRERLQFFN
jgi:cyclic beta-1,2-glucan synthetase